VEIIKEKSDFLRHPLMQELVTPEPNISEQAVQLMKFHGSYQQDNREERTFGAGKAYQFMMRTRQPAGLVSNQLYLVMDELADLVGGMCCLAQRDRKRNRRVAFHCQCKHKSSWYTVGVHMYTVGASNANRTAADRGQGAGTSCRLLTHCIDSIPSPTLPCSMAMARCA
jgi:hypothetical protein